MLRSLRSLGNATAVTLALLAGSACSSDMVTPTPDPKPEFCKADDVKVGLPLLGSDCDPLTPTQEKSLEAAA